ncbi:MAG: Nif3-like dinuclear metal center hexameric protein [Dyadobacter sp.]|uniref:Nif3-like dinuclear metal center hexameric protein n=1 Tax=Dyadobacter sp. TaxID=1914288 RepID=UPI00326337DC
MTSIKDVIHELEKLAPLDYQESYDNAGLLVGSSNTKITGVLFTLDVTEQVIEEAIEKNCNLIVAHHPIIFKGLKKLNGKNYVERTVIKAIKNDVAIYATHTNLDHVTKGVNWQIGNRLGLQNLKVLVPKKQWLTKLAFFVPIENTQKVLDALFTAGAGNIGNYEQCGFRTEGTGTFLPGDSANPVVGSKGQLEEVREHRAEVMFPSYLESKIVSTLKKTHPYEEVAYYLTALENENQEVGAGAVGDLANPMPTEDFLGFLKKQMNAGVVKHTEPVSKSIQRVAICGGAGSFLLQDAIRAQADVFVTADYKYHEFFDAENRIMICDIGHYESEVFTKNLLYNYLSGKFSNFALCLSEVNTNPVRYFV